jgi:tetratricopeptide (TPR) repeat protein
MSRTPALARSLLALVLFPAFALVPRAGAQSAAPEASYRANNVGVGLLEQYDYAAAATTFRRALELDSKLAIARVNLAIALLYAADFPAAEKEARAAAAALPGAPEPHYVLGLVAKGENRTDEAITELEKVLAAHPNDPGANVNLAQIHMARKQFPDAVKLLRAAVAAEPFSASAYYSLGIALTRAGQAAEGRKALDTFDELQKSGIAIVIDNAYPNQGKFTEALTSSGAEPGLVDPKAPSIRFADAGAALLPKDSSAAAASAPGRVTPVDLDGDGDLESPRGKPEWVRPPPTSMGTRCPIS